MGGIGSGGRRSGSGRPRKAAELRALDGRASHTAKVVSHPSVPVPQAPVAQSPVVDEADAPNDLAFDERKVWVELFPQAVLKGTLTLDEKNDAGFKILCKNIILERAQRMTEAGSSNHRGIQSAIRTDMREFGIRPSGSRVAQGAAPAAPAVDPVKEKYFGGR